jgi:hypothetical protein
MENLFLASRLQFHVSVCDAIPTKGIAAEAGVADLEALQKQLMNELREAALNLVDFAHSFFAAL